MCFQGRCVTINVPFLGKKKYWFPRNAMYLFQMSDENDLKHQKQNYNCWKSERDHLKTESKTLSWQEPVISQG